MEGRSRSPLYTLWINVHLVRIRRCPPPPPDKQNAAALPPAGPHFGAAAAALPGPTCAAQPLLCRRCCHSLGLLNAHKPLVKPFGCCYNPISFASIGSIFETGRGWSSALTVWLTTSMPAAAAVAASPAQNAAAAHLANTIGDHGLYGKSI